MAEPRDPQLLSAGKSPAGRAKIALVVSTLGRASELGRLFESLERQTFTSFEILLVDQNDDDRLAAIAAKNWSFPLRRIHTPGERGLSRGRNRGWRASQAELIIFPDDDCWYSPHFLEKAVGDMRRRGCDILTGRLADETGRSINGRFEEQAQAITRANVWSTAIEAVMFFRREVLETLGGFDEGIGIGADTPWQAAEGQDILLRAIAAGFAGWYDPDLTGHHPEYALGRPDKALRRKGRGYGRGMGFVLRRHDRSLGSRANWIARPLAGAVVSLLRGRPALMGYYGQVALGRLEGLAGRTLRGS